MKVAAWFLPLVVLLAGCGSGGGGGGIIIGPPNVNGSLILTGPATTTVGSIVEVKARFTDILGNTMPGYFLEHPYEWSYTGAATGDPGITVVNDRIRNADGTVSATFRVTKAGTYSARMRVMASQTSSQVVQDATFTFRAN